MNWWDDLTAEEEVREGYYGYFGRFLDHLRDLNDFDPQFDYLTYELVDAYTVADRGGSEWGLPGRPVIRMTPRPQETGK